MKDSDSSNNSNINGDDDNTFMYVKYHEMNMFKNEHVALSLNT